MFEISATSPFHWWVVQLKMLIPLIMSSMMWLLYYRVQGPLFITTNYEFKFDG